MMATRYYYALGRSTGYAINGTRQTTIAYDSFGRIATMCMAEGRSGVLTASNENEFVWSYLPNSDLKASLQYPNGLTASWTYDANNQLLQVRNATSTNVISQFDYTYDAAGRRVSIAKSGSAFGDLSGSIESYTYNARSELTSARRTKNGQPIPGFSEDFDYDPIGNRRSSATYNEKGEAQTSTYAANNLNQYTSRTTPGYAAVRGEADPNAVVTVNENPTFRLGSYYFGSDLFDNTAAGGLANLETYATLSQTAANGEEAEDLVSAETNQVYLAQSPEMFAYDDDGNQTLITTKTGTWRVTYNGENRPVLWVRDSDNTTLAMSYDHMGRRREKNDQRFFYEGYLQVAEFTTAIPNSSFLLRNSYAWDPTEPVATRPLAWTTPTTNHESPITNFYTHDGNKNVSEVVASDGTLAAHYEYAPFGEVTAQTRGNAWGAFCLSSLNPWRFSSEYAEDGIATVYFNYRHYELEFGRWNGRDLLGEEIIRNLYCFCDNNSVKMYDVIGCLPQWINEIVKKAGYEFWGSFMVGDGTWKEMLDDWYYERGSSVRQYCDGSQQVEDIKNNVGFRKLIDCSVAAQRGDDISRELNKCSPATSASAGSFYWHYAYPGKGKPAAGGSAAYQPVTHFLGSYGGTVTKESGGSVKPGLCRYKIRIQNTSGWTSGTRLPNFARNIGSLLRNRLPAWVGVSNWDPVSLFKNHERGRNDLYPISRHSKGGNFIQSYTFICETDCCASCELP